MPFIDLIATCAELGASYDTCMSEKVNRFVGTKCYIIHAKLTQTNNDMYHTGNIVTRNTSKNSNKYCGTTPTLLQTNNERIKEAQEHAVEHNLVTTCINGV